MDAPRLDAPRLDAPRLAPSLVEELHALDGSHWWRLLSFVGLYVGAGAALFYLADAWPDDPYALLARLPLYLLAGASLHGISLFTHEGVHGTLCRSLWLNRLVAAACAWPVLQNFAAYRVLHLKHHNHLGKEGDPDHYPNYTRWTWMQFLMNWGRLIVGYPAYITMIPILGFRHGTRTERWWIVWELAMLAGLITAVLLSPLPWALLLHAWLIPMLIINTLVNIRGMSQHTWLEPGGDPALASRSILTNPLTRFFMCNENYHLEHHLYPGVPWYNLPRVHRELRPELAARGAPFIRSYASFVWEFVVGSWQCRPWGKGPVAR